MKLFVKTNYQFNEVKFIEKDNTGEVIFYQSQIDGNSNAEFALNILQYIEDKLPYYDYSSIYFITESNIQSILLQSIEDKLHIDEMINKIHSLIGILEAPIEFISTDNIDDYDLTGLLL